jgi:hypothetical protein
MNLATTIATLAILLGAVLAAGYASGELPAPAGASAVETQKRS